MRSILIILAATLVVCAGAADSSEPEAMLAIRGKLLKEGVFPDQAAVQKGNKGGWNVYKGKFEVTDGHLKVTEQKEDGHHPAMSSKLPCKNVVIVCKIKLGDSKWMGLSLDNGAAKEHVFRAMLTRTGLSVKHMSGMGATTKGETIVEKKTKLDPEKWMTVQVELVNKQVCVQIPEAGIVVYGENEGIAMDKDRFEFISGGENAWFSDLKVFEAEANPKWAALKAGLPPMPATPAGAPKSVPPAAPIPVK